MNCNVFGFFTSMEERFFIFAEIFYAMADLTQTQWAEKLANDDNAVIVDVRTQLEVEEGYIPNMIHLDIFNAGAFMDAAREMDPTKNYFVYCKSGARSGQACAILNSLGFKNAYNLMGGFLNWEGKKTTLNQ